MLPPTPPCKVSFSVDSGLKLPYEAAEVGGGPGLLHGFFSHRNKMHAYSFAHSSIKHLSHINSLSTTSYTKEKQRMYSLQSIFTC
jgi:hypothetical protein